jgi:hypothetical protein
MFLLLIYTGRTFCLDCPLGKYAPNTGLAVCIECAPGEELKSFDWRKKREKRCGRA